MYFYVYVSIYKINKADLTLKSLAIYNASTYLILNLINNIYIYDILYL